MSNLCRSVWVRSSWAGIAVLVVFLGISTGVNAFVQDPNQQPGQNPTEPAASPSEKQPAKKGNPSPKNDTENPVEKSGVRRIPGYPPVEERIAEYLRMAGDGKVPREESRPYVIEGLTVIGMSGTASAFLKTEDGHTVIVRKGMKFYNGMVVGIEKDRVIFSNTKTKKLIEKRYGQAINASTGEEGEAQ